LTNREYKFPKNGYVDAATNLGHKFVFMTTFFGVDYAWMQDPTGKHYLHAKPFDI